MGSVLLVEDNPGAAEKIVRYIGNISEELAVHTVSEAGTALQYAKTNDISLFIIDIQLKDYKGTRLAKQLRELPEYRYTPIIFETALADEELSAYRDLKCYSFLIKPFTEEEFAEAFRDALGLSRQINRKARTIRIEQKQFILEYSVQDIAYIESFGKKLVIHTWSHLSGAKEDVISGYTLSGFFALLDDPEFVQCHKSYIVNKSYIEKIDKSGRKIFLRGYADAIPVGNKYQTELWGQPWIS
ncbi:MAG: LytR/AlgR family response regulator transcription factor [Oscillospiraceae bacterium]